MKYKKSISGRGPGGSRTLASLFDKHAATPVQALRPTAI